ncbi:MAG: 5-formyltetrahydrofolate cyclo-ligase [Clostridia bacterium]|nr:5-formyltetrahydrofolate cyclo-ligase [Clostridia bacterium]
MKSEIRKLLISKRMAQTSEEIAEKSAKIIDAVIKSGVLEAKKRIMVYMDFRKEVQTEKLIHYLLAHDYEVVLPRVSDDKSTMELYLIGSDEDMQASDFGILEPIPSKERQVASHTLDLILSPGVGFTKEGYRIGYGGGFYDKMLADIRDVTVCALAFECQMVEELPIEPHDQKLDMIITETHIYRIGDDL